MIIIAISSLTYLLQLNSELFTTFWNGHHFMCTYLMPYTWIQLIHLTCDCENVPPGFFNTKIIRNLPQAFSLCVVWACQSVGCSLLLCRITVCAPGIKKKKSFVFAALWSSGGRLANQHVATVDWQVKGACSLGRKPDHGVHHGVPRWRTRSRRQVAHGWNEWADWLCFVFTIYRKDSKCVVLHAVHKAFAWGQLDSPKYSALFF